MEASEAIVCSYLNPTVKLDWIRNPQKEDYSTSVLYTVYYCRCFFCETMEVIVSKHLGIFAQITSGNNFVGLGSRGGGGHGWTLSAGRGGTHNNTSPAALLVPTHPLIANTLTWLLCNKKPINCAVPIFMFLNHFCITKCLLCLFSYQVPVHCKQC